MFLNKNDLKMLNKSKSIKAERHGFHLVRPSPWPILTSFGLFQLVLYVLLIFHDFKTTKIGLLLRLIYLILVIGMWFRDVVIESTFQGFHTSRVQQIHRDGMVLVLVSETMFFFSIFWCFFYMAISPSIWIGCTWPPAGIEPIDPTGLPLLNTIILVSSGISATFAHRSMLVRTGRIDVFIGLTVSVILGLFFTMFQLWEYSEAQFSINDGIYGSIFYFATGFHGFHVIIGTIALIVCIIRHYFYHFQMEHHLGLEFSLWYWHFVDVIWIFLFIFIHWWGYKF
jgi:cytochrome c oxidase subunit 3